MKKRFSEFILLILSLCAFAKGTKDSLWISNPYYDLNSEDFIAAVGSGLLLEDAKKNALQEVSSSILQQINSEVSVSQSASSNGKENSTYTSSVQTKSKIDKISGLEIKNTCKEKKVYYARAVLEKSKAVQFYNLEINKKSLEIENLIEKNNKTTIERCSDLKKALVLAKENDEDLSIIYAIRPQTKKVLTYGSSSEIEVQLKNEFSKLTVLVQVENDKNDTIFNAFCKTFNDLGIKTTSSDSADYSYVLKANVKVEPLATSDDAKIYFSRISISADVSEKDSKKTVLSFVQNKRDGKLSQKEADSSVWRTGEKLITTEFAKELDKIL